ncbi:MAG: hypothetical protein GX868_07255 [Actinobacteria bacterium]|nr:hypothetical protein [Actinomycetota bacterium]
MRTRTGIAAALLSLSLIASGCGSDEAGDATITKKESTEDTANSSETTESTESTTGSDDSSSSSDDTTVDFDDLSIQEMSEMAGMNEGCFATSLLVGGAMAMGTEGFDENLLKEAESLVPDEIASDAQIMAQMIADSVGADGQVDFNKVMELSQDSEIARAGESVSAWFDANCNTEG